MTLKKGETRQSERRPYSYIGGNKAGSCKVHKITHGELNEWFVKWGIIGEKVLGWPNTKNS